MRYELQNKLCSRMVIYLYQEFSQEVYIEKKLDKNLINVSLKSQFKRSDDSSFLFKLFNYLLWYLLQGEQHKSDTTAW